jgi:uncharacterized protein
MAFVASALWKRIDGPGYDFCRLDREMSGWRLDGTSIFLQDREPGMFSYSLQCNSAWEAISGLVRGSLGSRAIEYAVNRRDGIWTLNRAPVRGLEHLVDLDFSFTPATNLTQLRRVPFPNNRVVELSVAWLDLHSGALTELPQIYERRGERLIWYEAPTVGYRGLLELDTRGFINRYPTLWEAEIGG